MLKVLTAFHHREAQRITGMKLKRGAGKEWEYPAVEEVIYSAEIHHIGVYIKRLQTTVADRLVCQTIYALCTKVEIMPGTRWMVRWWDE